jgi:hypothetical protein
MFVAEFCVGQRLEMGWRLLVPVLVCCGVGEVLLVVGHRSWIWSFGSCAVEFGWLVGMGFELGLRRRFLARRR